MSRNLRALFVAAVLAAGARTCLRAQGHPAPEPPPTTNQKQLPSTPGKDTVERVCGTCHSANIVLGRGLTRAEWSEVVNSMVSRGAKASQAEFTEVVDYLALNLPPNPAPGGGVVAPKRAGGGGLTVGPDDKMIVDADAADKGKPIYNQQCESCHGPKARGTNNGQDLVRSVVVLHDRYGSTLGPFLRSGHPSKTQSATLNEAQIKELSNFIHLMLNDTLRSGPYSKVLNVLTGDPRAGEAYFNGAGGCGQCHSTSGDLKGVASRYDPPTLQQRFLFPQVVSFAPGETTPHKETTVTVTTADGQSVTGVLDKIDDFDVSLHDSRGEYHAFKRTPDLRVEKHDPYAGHISLLDRYTDADVHNVVAYLETLK